MPPPRLIKKSTPPPVEAPAVEAPAIEVLPPIETPPADAPVDEVVEPKSRRCGKCQRKWSPPAADVCPECGGATQEE